MPKLKTEKSPVDLPGGKKAEITLTWEVSTDGEFSVNYPPMPTETGYVDLEAFCKNLGIKCSTSRGRTQKSPEGGVFLFASSLENLEKARGLLTSAINGIQTAYELVMHVHSVVGQGLWWNGDKSYPNGRLDTDSREVDYRIGEGWGYTERSTHGPVGNLFCASCKLKTTQTGLLLNKPSSSYQVVDLENRKELEEKTGLAIPEVYGMVGEYVSFRCNYDPRASTNVVELPCTEQMAINAILIFEGIGKVARLLSNFTPRPRGLEDERLESIKALLGSTQVPRLGGAS